MQDKLEETLKYTLHSNFNILHQVHPVWNGTAYEMVLSSDAVPQSVVKLVVNEFPDANAFLFTKKELKLICELGDGSQSSGDIKMVPQTDCETERTAPTETQVLACLDKKGFRKVVVAEGAGFLAI